jgi:periplasmic protein CpxP/Spy
MKRIHKILIGAAGVLAVAAATAVVAAPHDGMGPCGGGPGMGMMHGEHGRGGDMAAMAEKHLAKLKTDLKITAQQEPAWQAFATKAAEQAKAMQAQHQQHMQERDKGAPANVSAPDRMAEHLSQMKQHLAGMESMQAAVKDLYAALTPEQRALADKHFDRMHNGPMDHRMHRG